MMMNHFLPPPRLIIAELPAVAAITRNGKGRAKATTDGDIDTVSTAAIAANAVGTIVIVVVSTNEQP
jgi:hypothetical protein